jgi:hypothetical protein
VRSAADVDKKINFYFGTVMPEVVLCVGGISRKLHIGILFFQLTEWHNRLAGDLRPNQHSARGIAH